MSGGPRNGVAILAGRFNPPTRGHDVLVQELKRVAASLNVKPILFIVDGEKSSRDKTKNPLTADQRRALAQRLFPGLTIDVVSSAYEAVEVLDLQGYRIKSWVAGSDRASRYRKLLASESLDGEVVEVDREAGEADGVSATKARQAALDGDMEAFAHHMPSSLDAQELADVAEMIREVHDGRRLQE